MSTRACDQGQCPSPNPAEKIKIKIIIEARENVNSVKSTEGVNGSSRMGELTASVGSDRGTVEFKLPKPQPHHPTYMLD